MPLIKLTPELLREKAEELKKYAEQNEQVVQDLNSILNGPLASWEGPAQEAFRTSYVAKRATFVTFSDTLRQFAQEVINYADVMENEEENQRRRAVELGA